MFYKRLYIFYRKGVVMHITSNIINALDYFIHHPTYKFKSCSFDKWFHS